MPQAELTSRQRVMRLRKAALDVLARYDFRVDRLRLLPVDWNCRFRVETPDGVRYILRLSAVLGCHGLDETLAEIEWLRALRRETDLNPPQPVAMRDGSFVGTVDETLAPDHRQHVLFTWQPGRTLGDRISPGSARLLGRYTASLHEHAQAFTLRIRRIRRFDRVFPYADETFADREPVLIFDDRFGHLFSPDLLDVYEQARRRAEAVTDELFSDERALRVIHNDLHPWNVLTHRGQLTALDFEDMMWGYPIQDIATTFYYLRCRANAAPLEDAYRSGYETIAPWPIQHADQLNALIAGRGLILANTVLASPDQDVRAKADHYIPLIGERLRRWLQ